MFDLIPFVTSLVRIHLDASNDTYIKRQIAAFKIASATLLWFALLLLWTCLFDREIQQKVFVCYLVRAGFQLLRHEWEKLHVGVGQEQEKARLEENPTPVPETSELPAGPMDRFRVTLIINLSDGSLFKINGTAYHGGTKTTVLYDWKHAKLDLLPHPTQESIAEVLEDEEPSNIRCEVTYSAKDTYKIKLMLFSTMLRETPFFGPNDESRWLITAYPEDSKDSEEEDWGKKDESN